MSRKSSDLRHAAPPHTTTLSVVMEQTLTVMEGGAVRLGQVQAVLRLAVTTGRLRGSALRFSACRGHQPALKQKAGSESILLNRSCYWKADREGWRGGGGQSEERTAPS